MSRRYDDRFKIPKDIIIDCVCRFMLNPNSRILEDPIWFSSYLELAYWFYKDQYMDERPRELKNVTFPCFVEQAVQELKIPIPKGKTSAQLCAEFVEFKHRVNTYGGILVNPELNKVLLVQSFNGQSWGFPKGKIEENEVPVLCAIREVKEEIDYDMSPYINPDDFIEMMILDQVTVLYVIHGVPENTPFKTNTRKEIGDIKWFDVDMLPLHKGDKKPLRGTNYTPNNFFITIPFVKAIREHLDEMRQRCVDTFKAPVYEQQCHMEYLRTYYPETFRICEQHVKETRQEREEINKREEATKAAQRRVYRIPFSDRTLRTDHQELMPKAVVAVKNVPEITLAEVPTILEMLQRAKTRSEGLEELIEGIKGLADLWENK